MLVAASLLFLSEYALVRVLRNNNNSDNTGNPLFYLLFDVIGIAVYSYGKQALSETLGLSTTNAVANKMRTYFEMGTDGHRLVCFQIGIS